MRICHDRERNSRRIPSFGGVIRNRPIVAKRYGGERTAMDGRQNGIETVARRQQPERLSGIEECRQGQSEQLITSVSRYDVCRSEAVQASDARAESTGKRIRIALQHVEWKGTQGVRNGGGGGVGSFVRVLLDGWAVRRLGPRVALPGLYTGAVGRHIGNTLPRRQRRMRG